MRRIRCLIVPTWYPSPGDPVAGTFVREAARAIARRHDVTVLYAEPVRSPSGPPRQLADGVEDGLRTVRVRFRVPGIPHASFPLRLLALRAGLAHLARAGFRPELIHAHVFVAGFAAVLLGRRHALPVILSEHYTGFPRGQVSGIRRLLARFTFEHADLVCPVSEDLGRHIEALGIRARLRPVPNVVDTSVFTGPARECQGGPVRMLLVAMLDPKKGVAYLLEALARLPSRRRDFRLDIVGDGPSRAELERLAATLGVDGVVRFLGVRERREVADLMRAADFFVLPSLWENLPVALIEALACGLPVVATDVGGVSELVDAGSGVLVPPGDAEALAVALDRMLDAHRDFDAATIARAAHERFGYEAVGSRWDVVYREVLAEFTSSR